MAKNAKVKNSLNDIDLKKIYLTEIAWEVCNQVGGIYTVIRSKTPSMTDRWGDRFCMIGPLIEQDVTGEFDPIQELNDPFGRAVAKMRSMGWNVLYGRWLVSGRPKVVLLDINDSSSRLEAIRKRLQKDHQLVMKEDDQLQNQVIAFADLTKVFLTLLAKEVKKSKRNLIAHFHEWMASIPLLDLKKENASMKTVFTTHATALGRFVAMNNEDFYTRLPRYNWKELAQNYHIMPIVQVERASAQHADVFTTVSEVTGKECKYFLGKEPDVITPNGLNIERFVAFHEVQNLHQHYKEAIHQFIMGHFFHSYSFDLDNTLYFFTSGRYEFRNKGFDITLDALVQLNQKMKKAKLKQTVVFFFVTKRPFWSVNPDVLHSRGVMEEIRKVCSSIEKQVGMRLFNAAATSETDHRLPNLTDMVEDFLKLKYRRILRSWKSKRWPIVVTHNLVDDISDEILQYLRNAKLINSPEDKVKVVYHPDFIDSTNPLFGIDYSEFVRGCHLGIFPSFYEPWGYTPLECIARGVPAITSDFSGFGAYTKNHFKDHDEYGVYVLKRYRRDPRVAAKELANVLFNFVKQGRRNRMVQRNKAEDLSENFDWSKLTEAYEKAYQKALAEEPLALPA